MIKSFASFVRRVHQGFMTPYRGAQLLRLRKELWPYAIAPLFFSMLLVAAATVATIHFVPQWMWAIFHLAAHLNIWTEILRIFLSLCSFFVFLILGNLLLRVLTVPFNALLAERCLLMVSTSRRERLTLAEWVRRSLVHFGESLLKTCVLLVIVLVLMLLSFVPGLQPVTSSLCLLLSAVDCFDYVFEADNLPLRTRIAFLARYFPEFVGLGASLGILFLIPVLNLLFFPAAIAGASVLYSQLQNSYKKPH